jgi:tetratricopeptide (TPR) repeat protein
MGSTALSGTDPLAAGRVALRNAAWDEARARFEEAVDAGDAPEAWEGLGRAAWWQGDQEETLAARERAYRAYREAGDVCGAARMAMWLASDHLDFRGDDAGLRIQEALALVEHDLDPRRG